MKIFSVYWCRVFSLWLQVFEPCCALGVLGHRAIRLPNVLLDQVRKKDKSKRKTKSVTGLDSITLMSPFLTQSSNTITSWYVMGTLTISDPFWSEVWHQRMGQQMSRFLRRTGCKPWCHPPFGSQPETWRVMKGPLVSSIFNVVYIGYISHSPDCTASLMFPSCCGHSRKEGVQKRHGSQASIR